MNTDYNKILNRTATIKSIKNIILEFKHRHRDINYKRGIYVYGHSGIGKTMFVRQILNELNYDIIELNAGDLRNKGVIDSFNKKTMANTCIFSMFTKTRPIAIIMDEIDGMNNGDKGGINSLIKIIRHKKTKRQNNEEISSCPIICISGYHIDKKIKDLMKICNVFELERPTTLQISHLVNMIMPDIKCNMSDITKYVNGDLRKINMLNKIYKHDNENIAYCLQAMTPKSDNNSVKQLTYTLLTHPTKMSDHGVVINDSDRTIIGLLWHENVIDLFNKKRHNNHINLYINILSKMCFADYIDRITFQKQLWMFNELSSLIKTFQCNYLLFNNDHKLEEYNKLDNNNIRFTKVLTKYSTEYNNETFMCEICQKLSVEKKDVYYIFEHLRNTMSIEDIYQLYHPYDITKLEICRLYRYIDNCTATKENIENCEDLIEDMNMNEFNIDED